MTPKEALDFSRIWIVADTMRGARRRAADPPPSLPRAGNTILQARIVGGDAG